MHQGTRNVPLWDLKHFLLKVNKFTSTEDCDLRLHRYLLAEILRKEDNVMLTIGNLVEILGLCLSCFGLGYSIGRGSKTQK